MIPNQHVTFQATVRLRMAVCAHGKRAACFAAAHNAVHVLVWSPAITQALAEKHLHVLSLEPMAFEDVEPLPPQEDVP